MHNPDSEKPQIPASHASFVLCAEGVRPPMPPPSFPPPDHAGPPRSSGNAPLARDLCRSLLSRECPRSTPSTRHKAPWPLAVSVDGTWSLVAQRCARVRTRAKANLPNGTHGRANQRPGCSGPCDHVRSCNKSAALKPLGGHAADWAALTVAGGGHSLERSCMSCALSCCVAQVWQLEPLQIQTDRVSSVHDLIPFFRPGGKFLDSSLDGFFVRLVPARAAPTYQLTLLREPIWCFRVSGTGASASTLSRKQPEQ